MISGDYKPGQVLSSLSKKQLPSFKNDALKSLFSPEPVQPRKRILDSFDTSSSSVQKKKKKHAQQQEEETESSKTSPKSKRKKKQNDSQPVTEKDISHSEKDQPGKARPVVTSPSQKSRRKKQKDLVSVLDREKSLRDADTAPKKKKKKKIGTGKVEPRTVFVGNLPVSCTKKELKKMFKKYGDIESVRLRSAAPADPSVPKRVVIIKKETHPDRHNINAYIIFMNKEDAAKAVALNGKDVGGLHVRVDLAINSKKHDTKSSIFIGNLPFDIEEESLREHFTDCGHIENIRIIRDSRTGLGKGFAYIQFQTADGVSVALQLDGKELSGRKLRVTRCVKKEKKKQVLDLKVPGKFGHQKKRIEKASKQKTNTKFTGTEAKATKRFSQPSNARTGSFALKKTMKKSKKKKGWKITSSSRDNGSNLMINQPNYVKAEFRLRKKMTKSRGRGRKT